MAKTILLEEQKWYYLTHSWENKWVHTFPMSICPKLSIIVRRDFEHAIQQSSALTIAPRGKLSEKVKVNEIEKERK